MRTAPLSGRRLGCLSKLFCCGGARGRRAAGLYARERPSSHWLVENVSADYKTLNREPPVCLWLMVRERQEADAAVRYFNRSNGAQGPGCEEMFDDISATVYRAPDGGAAQARISAGTFGLEPCAGAHGFSQLF